MSGENAMPSASETCGLFIKQTFNRGWLSVNFTRLMVFVQRAPSILNLWSGVGSTILIKGKLVKMRTDMFFFWCYYIIICIIYMGIYSLYFMYDRHVNISVILCYLVTQIFICFTCHVIIWVMWLPPMGYGYFLELQWRSSGGTTGVGF